MNVKHPPIADLFRHAPDIMALAAGRRHVMSCLADGTLEPQAKSCLRWDQALWLRATELMLAAPNPSFVYNVSFTWWNSAELAAFQQHYRKRIEQQL